MIISTDIEKKTLTEIIIFHAKKKKKTIKIDKAFFPNSWTKTRKSILTSSIQYYTGSSSLFYLDGKGTKGTQIGQKEEKLLLFTYIYILDIAIDPLNNSQKKLEVL